MHRDEETFHVEGSGVVNPRNTPMAHGAEQGSNVVGEEVHDVLSRILPWSVSILLHAGVILLAVFAAWSVAIETPPGFENIVPIANFSPMPGAPLVSAKHQIADRSFDHQFTHRVAPANSNDNPASIRPGENAGDGVGVGVGKGSSPGVGLGKGDPNGLIGVGSDGGGPGGHHSPFGSGVHGEGLTSSVFGVRGGNATRIVYLVDASGNLIDTLPFIITELKRSIGELSDRQEFTVIFFQGTDPTETPTPHLGLKKANAQSKREVYQWLDQHNIIPQGGNSPIKAMRLALQYKPQLMYVLSGNITGSGKFQVDQRRLLRDVTENNTASTRINTIQFIFRDPLESLGLEPTMKRIADGSGGIYKFLSAKELGIE